MRPFRAEFPDEFPTHGASVVIWKSVEQVSSEEEAAPNPVQDGRRPRARAAMLVAWQAGATTDAAVLNRILQRTSESRH